MTSSSLLAAESAPREVSGGCRVRVVGLGTPSGDDRAGWDVIARIQGALPRDARAEATSDPLRVLHGPPECARLVVIDSCRGAGRAGTVHRFIWPDPRLIITGGVSSHGVGLATALELAAALNQLPPRVVVFAVECGSTEPGAELSPEVALALPGVAARVLAEVTAELDESPGRTG
jgi:hydrogenase maturation protease